MSWYKMRLLLIILALSACLLNVVLSTGFLRPVPEHPEQPGKCQYKGLAIALNDTITDHSSCDKLTCRKRATTAAKRPTTYFVVEGFGCDIASTWPINCILETPDRTKNFPDCCPQLECDGPPEGEIFHLG